jgi:hypothetical protein
MRAPLLIATALATASTAHALNQSKHYDVAVQSCTAAGLPGAFCRRVGTDTYNVDAREFNDLAAHSQIPVELSACDAANNALWREFWLGEQIRAATLAAAWTPSRANHDALAHWMGRAIHTIQDNCAHSGMPNPQHAWHSLSDVCQHTSESPDIVPAAASCARVETDAFLAAFVDVLHDNGGDFAQLANVTADSKHWPAYSDVCAFLGSASDWDGIDRRWDNSVMRPALRNNLTLGLGGAPESQFARVCNGGWDDDVTLWWSDPDRDTSGGAQSCVVIHAFCLGKADSEAPPYELLDTDASADATQAAGCSFVGAGAGAGVRESLTGVFLLASLLGLSMRSRRNSRRARRAASDN